VQNPSEVPRVLGKYAIASVLGADEVGTFYLAQHQDLGSDAVVKWVHPYLARNATIQRLFRSDAQVSARINHPGIIRVLDLGEAEDRPFIVTEYLEGETLRERLRSGALEPQRALEIVGALAKTLNVLFTRLQICDPGIRPSNIRLGPNGEVKLGRLSTAKILEAGRVALASYGKLPEDRPADEVVAYVAPERLLGHRSGPPGDIYELGAVLYHTLTGQPLVTDLQRRLVTQGKESTAALPALFPDDLRSMVAAMLDPDPSARPQSYDDLLAEIGQVTASLSNAKPHVFISAKSEDYQYANRVYEYLTSHAVPAFFSERSLRRLASADYRKQIDQALDAVTHLVLVTSSAANALSPWVEAEWGFFVNEKRSGRKTGNLVTIAVGGLQPRDLPPALRYYEVIAYADDNLPRLSEYVSESSGQSHRLPDQQ
jgi:serine/threonine protein kinase